MAKQMKHEGDGLVIGAGSGDVSRDVSLISLISNGGGSTCLEGDGLGIHGGGSGG